VDGIQVEKVLIASQSKSGNVWVYNTVCTGYTRSPLTLPSRLPRAEFKMRSWWMGSKRGKWQAQVSECMDLG
jgi:hypothetical protein